MNTSGSEIKIITGNANPELAAKIAERVGVKVSECEVTKFSDGEISVNIKETIRGCDVFVVQSTNNPVNQNLMELLIIIDALKRASAVIKFATNFAVIGSLDFAFLSCLAYP